MQKTKIEIINETAEFYNLTNRGVEPGSKKCKYLTGDKKMCAVGRCMIENDWMQNYMGGVYNLILNKGSLNQWLKPEYQGHSNNFWADLQEFHDEESNFTQTGLSNSGNSQKNYLLEKYQ